MVASAFALGPSQALAAVESLPLSTEGIAVDTETWSAFQSTSQSSPDMAYSALAAAGLFGAILASVAAPSREPQPVLAPEGSFAELSQQGQDSSLADRLVEVQRALGALTSSLSIASRYWQAGENVTSETHAEAAKEMYTCFRANAGAYIKMGQLIRQLDQLLPPEYTTELQPLMDAAPRTSFADVRTIVREEFGKELDELFSEFDPVPLGSASLGQAHRAVLRATGEEVAVKIQHKNVRRQSPGDIRLFGLVLRGAEALFPDFKYAWLAEEFRELLPPELNFKKEAENCERCAEIFKDNPSIVVPSVFHEYTTERVLTMSYEEGVSMTQLDEENTYGIDFQRCAELISEAFSYMIFDRGFLHCDPHAGNIIVR